MNRSRNMNNELNTKLCPCFIKLKLKCEKSIQNRYLINEK